MKISDIKPPIHDVINVAELAKSMQSLGQLVPIVVSKGHIVSGQGLKRYLAAKHLGWTEINAIELDALTDEQIFMIQDFMDQTRPPEALKISNVPEKANPAKVLSWPEFAASCDRALFTFGHFRFGEHFKPYFDLFLSNSDIMQENSLAVFWCNAAEMLYVVQSLMRVAHIHPEPLIHLHEPEPTRPAYSVASCAKFGVMCTFGKFKEIESVSNIGVNDQYFVNYYAALLKPYGTRTLSVDKQKINAHTYIPL